MLYTYGLTVGAKQLMAGDMRGGIRHVLIPQSYWRTVETRFICAAGDFQPTDRVLDIGSPKLLSLYLAKRLGAEVFSTDIDGYFVPEYTRLRAIEGLSPDVFHVQVEDGRRLSFPDGSFNKVYSMSVLEHIPEHGDSACVKEIARVLEPGGRAMLTVPFWPSSRSDYKPASKVYWAPFSKARDDGQVFFQRRYSEADLRDRLIGPSGLKLRALHYVGERVLASSQREVYDYIPLPVAVAIGPIQPVLSRVLHTEPSSSWRSLRKPLCALICLEKA